jgi:RHS repeat-associated protein
VAAKPDRWTPRLFAPFSGAQSRKYYINDELGSVSAILGGAGALLEQDSYDAWGLRRNTDGTPASHACSIASSNATRGFTNQEMIDSICMVNLNARLYDPVIGRIPVPDSVIPDTYNLQSLNRYSYVINGPLSLTDETGNDYLYSPQINPVANALNAGGDNWSCYGSCGTEAITMGCIFCNDVAHQQASGATASAPNPSTVSVPSANPSLTTGSTNPSASPSTESNASQGSRSTDQGNNGSGFAKDNIDIVTVVGRKGPTQGTNGDIRVAMGGPDVPEAEPDEEAKDPIAEARDEDARFRRWVEDNRTDGGNVYRGTGGPTYFTNPNAGPVPETPESSGLGRAPKNSVPNSIYEQVDQAGNVRSRTWYNERGQPFSRQDYDHPHGGVQPHEHLFNYNALGQPTGGPVRPLPSGY